MKHAIVLFILFLFTTLSGLAQSKLGEVASVNITTNNLDSSAAVYEKLGFKKIKSNEYPSPWMQLSDGSLLITLRKDAVPFMGLAYYSSNVEQIAGQLEKDGIVFIKKPKEGDFLKRYFFKSPDGFDIILSNNPGGFEKPMGNTMLDMKQKDYLDAAKFPNSNCGVLGEYSHPVTDLKSSIMFWEKLGFKSKAEMKEPYPLSILTDGLMIIGLHQTKHFDYPAITYFGLNTAKRVERLKESGLQQFTEFMGKENVVLKTWEGSHVFIFSLGM